MDTRLSWTEQDPPDWRVFALTVPEAAEVLRVHHNTIRNLIKSGELKAYKQLHRQRMKLHVPMWSVYDYQKERATQLYQQVTNSRT